MQVLVPDPAPMQPSEVEIVRSEIAFERFEMEQKYLRLQEVADKTESNAQIHERKAQRMVMFIPRQRTRMKTYTWLIKSYVDNLRILK